jgi:hypothetical protein
MDNPGLPHWDSLLDTLAYLRSYPNGAITYGINIRPEMELNRLYVYVDADHASTDVDTRKSITGFIIYFNGGIISWKTSVQKTNSSSTTESEYKALHAACTEAVWLYRILSELGLTQPRPVIVYEDNSSTMRAAVNPVEFSRLKHVDIIYHATRDFIQQGLIELIKVDSLNNEADDFTKAINVPLALRRQSQYIKIWR